MPEISKQIKDIISEKLSLKKEKISDKTTLFELGADSIDLIDIIMTLEERFNVHVEDEKIEKMTSVGDIIEYFREKTNKLKIK